ANPEETILDVAKREGIYIPTLCHDARLKPYGACRLCLVEMEGAKGFLLACATTVTNGMVINTDTVTLHEIRKTIIELLLSDHPMDCLVCESAGRCELQDVAYNLGIDLKVARFEGGKHVYAIEDFNPLIERDPNKCILCGRCVRICAEVQQNFVYDFINRGFESIVTTPYDRSLTETPCEFCGQCISTCPTSALIERRSKYRGRVWETKKVKTICPYCGCGCQIELYVRNNEVVRVSTEVGSGLNEGNLCVKGRFGYEFINYPDRLTSPLIKKNGKFKKVSWEEAINLIATKLSETKEKFGADSISVIASAKCTNEENYLLQKFTRAVIGTNNIDHCARLCHAPTVAGLSAAFGSGAMTNSIADIAQAKVILVIGSNTTEAHPIIALQVKKAISENDAKLIVIDPRKIGLVDYTYLWLAQRPGTDVAVLNGLMNVILTEGLEDKDFIKTRTEGFEELQSVVSKYTPEFVEKISGVPAEKIKEAARIYAQAERATVLYTMGLTQHTTGTNNVFAIANLAMLTGNIGQPGTGVNPLRGQNNVQGACDMGALPGCVSGYQNVCDLGVIEKCKDIWGTKLPENPGLSLTEMIDAALSSKVKAMYIVGENPILSNPDISHVKEALEKLDFLIVQDIFLTETAELADVVLPAASFAEKDGTFTNTERRVQRIRKAIEPIGDSKPDWQIICELSKAMGYEMNYSFPSEIFDEISQITPTYKGITFDRVNLHGVQWPCPEPNHPGTPILHKERFTRGLGKFHAVEFKESAELPDEEYPFILT
ncbi:MAG: formate dehydrogenase subunit alpha, partial [Candidatus Subteraquimicrobiales bacterium]|nr:formate dehydrogenase subunit alpha [Candidatus Subteraquimicrobiales bacterium]